MNIATTIIIPPIIVYIVGISLIINIDVITANTGSPTYTTPAAVGSIYNNAFVFINIAYKLANNAVKTIVKITTGFANPEKLTPKGRNNDDKTPTSNNW